MNNGGGLTIGLRLGESFYVDTTHKFTVVKILDNRTFTVSYDGPFEQLINISAGLTSKLLPEVTATAGAGTVGKVHIVLKAPPNIKFDRNTGE